tara:strand:+ start:3905 stop:4255 length:351 start_codon:yes stop_codon:yes gene_type:complete
MAAPTITDGSTTLTLNVNEDLKSSTGIKLVSTVIPERAGDILQFLGRNSERLTIGGFTNQQSEKNQLVTWRNAGTALTYTDDEHTNLSVRIQSFSFSLKPGLTNHYEFDLVLVEDV